MSYVGQFERSLGHISAVGKVGRQAHLDLLYSLCEARSAGFNEIVLDFGPCKAAYPNGMVPVLCTVEALRAEGLDVAVQLPSDPALFRLFVNTNWAHFLAPSIYPKSDTIYDKHLATQRFTNGDEQKVAVDGLIDVLLRTIEIPRSQLQALEWSTNEITDNVLNHSEAKRGGFIQATAFKDNVQFTVADSGIGILSSLRQGFPDLPDDITAIGEAVKFGVTRGRAFGKGFGLAGTLALASASGGSFEMVSGRGLLQVFSENGIPVSQTKSLAKAQEYRGTIVNAAVFQAASTKMQEALSLTANSGGRWDFLDAEYTTEDESAFHVVILEETTGVGTRSAGRQLRTKCSNLLSADPSMKLVLDWGGVPMIASSFADEFVGRLFIALGPLQFMTRVRLVGMEPLIAQIIEQALKEGPADHRATEV